MPIRRNNPARVAVSTRDIDPCWHLPLAEIARRNATTELPERRDAWRVLREKWAGRHRGSSSVRIPTTWCLRRETTAESLLVFPGSSPGSGWASSRARRRFAFPAERLASAADV